VISVDHLCDLVEGKWNIQLLIKKLATNFPLSDEVNAIFLQSHGTAKSASFLREDEVLWTLNIYRRIFLRCTLQKAYVIYDIEDGLNTLNHTHHAGC
jgi:hypothetical protein